MKTLYMGTPEFSRIVLKHLCENNLKPIAAVTRADKPSGRGYSITQSPVKKFCLENKIEILQPEKLSDESFQTRLKELSPDIIVVVAYGKILPRSVLNFPKYGCINAHASLLPSYRGAAPMQRAIMDGRSETGVTIMKMDEGLDTGDMILKLSTPITEEDNLETIHDKLAALSGEGLIKSIESLQNGTAVFTKQDNNLANYAEKITKNDCIIDFSRSAKEISCQVRGLSPVPLAFCLHNNKILKITNCIYSDKDTHSYKNGEVISVGSGIIKVSCGQGTLDVLGVFPESKRKMSASDYINGGKIKVGDVLG